MNYNIIDPPVIETGVKTIIGVSLNGIIRKTNLQFKVAPSSSFLSSSSISQTITITIPNNEAVAFIGVFENINTDPTDPIDNLPKEPRVRHPELPTAKPIESSYSDVTQHLKVVDDNLKICPYNRQDGSIKNVRINDVPRGYIWIADEPVYPIIIPREGYINFHQITEVYNKPTPGGWCVGICDYTHGVYYDGLLMFPYGPAVLTDLGTPVDNYGPYMEDFHHPGIDENGSPFYMKTGRIMGTMTDGTIGLVTIDANADMDTQLSTGTGQSGSSAASDPGAVFPGN